MHIVKFRDGTYGIRKYTILGYRYRSFYNPDFWWPRNSECFGTCCKANETTAQILMAQNDDKGVRVCPKH